MPTQIKTKDGFRVNFHWPTRGQAGSKQYRRQFTNRKYDDAYLSARIFIRSIVGGGKPSTGDSSLSDIIDFYLRWCETSGFKRQSTLKTGRQRLTTFVAWCEADG